MKCHIHMTQVASSDKELKFRNNVPVQRPSGSVVDLCCGAGGLSHGFFLEGFRIAAGIDVDEACRFPFEQNNGAPFMHRDITGLRGSDISALFVSDGPRILIGCMPCQPFSTYNQKNSDPSWRLLEDFANLIVDVHPDIVSMENVPRLVQFKNGEIFNDFISTLEREGYKVFWKIVFAPDYGVPQRRRRLVLIASRLGRIELELPILSSDSYSTVKATIADLPKLRAGETDPHDSLHRASRLSEKNLKRIKAARPGGTWKEWDRDLLTNCHKADTGKSYFAVYGRMAWDALAPTITTQFYGFGSGRFGHPEQDRAISLREGAMLQSFPRSYTFVPIGNIPEIKKVGSMIGNAVPVLLAQAVARSIASHLHAYSA